jgi:hypothetical protein
VAVWPARGLLGDRPERVQSGDRFAGDVEDDVVGAPGEPEDRVVLRRRHRIVVGTDEVVVEATERGRTVGGGERSPQFGPEAGDEVDAPIVVRGSRSDAMAVTSSGAIPSCRASNSR